MSKPARYRNGNRWRKVRSRLRARGDACALCGKEIDYTLPAGHPMSFAADHIMPVSRGGDRYSLDNLQATHAVCNNKKSNKIDGGTPGLIPVSRDWSHLRR